jgi:hypothetical protein
MAYNLSAFAGAGAQFFDSNGVPLAGGLLYVYTAGTTTPATTWTTSSGAVANTNPIVLNAAGRTPYEIWLNSGVTYKFALYTSTNVLIGTYDNIPAIDDPTVFNNLITVTGTNDLIGTSVPPYTSYVAGMTLSFIPVATNTGAVTIDVDGLGAKNIFVGNASALTGSELVAGRIANLEYDGTRFQLFTSAIANDAVTTAKIANDAVTTAKIANGAVTAAKLASGVAVSNLGFTPVQQSGGANQLTNKLYIGWGPSSTLLLQVDATDFGAVWPITPAALSTASGSAPSYAARAWVNFNGVGTVAIRASGNVSSITDNGVGDYTVNFSTALPNANYAVAGASQTVTGNVAVMTGAINQTDFAKTTSSFRIGVFNSASGTAIDVNSTNVIVVG